MREEIRNTVRKDEGSRSVLGEERIEEVERCIKRLEKGMVLNSGKITTAYDRMDSISSSIDGHMDLINAEVNKAIAKIVNFVNDKVSKPLTDSL
jgi:hypothetical protein